MRIYVVSLILAISFAQTALAQQVFPVAVNGFLLPPHSLDLSVYAFDRAADISFNATLNDPVEPFRDVRLHLTIKNDNQDLYETNPNFAFTPIRLNQFQLRTFNGGDLAPYLSPEALVGASGFGMGSLEIPEGFNQICLEIVDVLQNKVISNQYCTFGIFTLNNPPQLLLPPCGTVMEIPQTQNLIFNWTPRHLGSGNNPAPVEYLFELKELLPGVADPNDGFDNALQIYSTTVMTPSLLYTQAQPLLRANKSYAWRVRARSMIKPTSKLFLNDGLSEICTFTYTEGGEEELTDAEEDNIPIPQGCEVFSTDFGPVNAQGDDPIPLVEGDIVKMGFFEMEVLDATPSGDGFAGSGFVAVPLLNAKFPVNFENLKVKGNMRAFGVGSMRAVVDNQYALNSNLLVAGNYQNVITEEYVENLKDFFASPLGQSRLVSSFNPSDPIPTNLPIAIDKEENGKAQPTIAVTGIRFTERNAYMDCVGYQALEGGGLLRFFKAAVEITPIGVKSNATLSLLDEVATPISPVFAVSIAPGNVNSGMGMNCNGFSQMNLEPQIQVNSDYMLLANDEPIVFDLSNTTNNATQYLGGIGDFDNFKIPSLPGFEFEMNSGKLDLLANQALEFANPNQNYTVPTENEWQGLHLEGVQVTLPPEFDFTGGGKQFQLSTGELFLSEEGTFGNFSGNNLIAMEEGRIGEWPFSVDLFELSLVEGSPNSTSIAGKIQVPLLDEAFDYAANLDVDGSNIQIEASPAPGAYQMGMWKGTFKVEEGTAVNANLVDLGNGQEFFPDASLTGKLSFSIDEATFANNIVGDAAEKMQSIRQAFKLSGDLTFDLADLQIEGFKVDPFAAAIDKYSIEGYGTGEDSLEISGKMVPITGLNILYNTDAGEALGLELEVTEKLNELTFIIWAKLDENGRFIFDRIETSTRKVDCNCASNDEMLYDPAKLDQYLLKYYHEFYAPGKPNYADFSVGGDDVPNYLNQEKLDELHQNVVMAHLSRNNINGFVVDDITNVSEVYIPFLGATIKIDNNGRAEKDDTPMTLEGIDSHLPEGGKWKLPYDLTNQIDEFLYDNETQFPKDARLLITDFTLPNSHTDSSIPEDLEIEITLLVKLTDPAGANHQYLTFVNETVKIGPDEVGFSDLKLFLTEDATYPDPQFSLKYLAKEGDTDASTGSYAYLQCEGFQFYNVQAEYEVFYHGEGSVSNSLKTKNPVEDANEGYFINAKFPMTINSTDINKFISPLKTTDDLGNPVTFQIDGLEYKQVYVEEGFFDFDGSQDANAAGYTGSLSDFKGVVFSKINVEVEGLMTKEGTGRAALKVPGYGFSYTPYSEGIVGFIDLQDVIPRDVRADLGGWRYELTKFQYGMTNDANAASLITGSIGFGAATASAGDGVVGGDVGQVVTCAVAGKMLLPIFMDIDANWVAFNGDLTMYGGLGDGFDGETTTYYPTGAFDLGDPNAGEELTDQTFTLEWIPGMSMKLQGSTIDISFNRNNGEFEAAATLNGKAGIYVTSDAVDQGQESTFNFGFDMLAFEGLGINVSESSCGSEDAIGGIKDLDFGTWGIAEYGFDEEAEEEDNDDGREEDEDSEGDEEEEEGLNGFPISLEALQFNCVAPGSWSLLVGLKMNLVPGEVTDEGTEDEAETAGLSATTQLNFVFEKNSAGKLAYKEMLIDAIYVEGEFAEMSVNGFLVFMRNDALWGNGVKGYLSVTTSTLQLQAMAQFGTTKADNKNGTHDTAYRYFFMDVEFVSEIGIPLHPLPITVNGVSGGIFFNCDAQSPTDGIDPFTTVDDISSGGQVGSTTTSDTNLAVECPFGDLCDPGAGLSLYNYEPSLGAMGLHIGLIASLSGKPSTLVAELKIGAEFYVNVDNGSFRLNQINAQGSVFIQAESIIDRAEAPIVGTIDIGVDFENMELRGAFTVTMGYEEPADDPLIVLTAEIAGSMQFQLQDPGRWNIKIGAPLEQQQVTLEVVDLLTATVGFYFQMGHDVDPIPAIKDIVPNWPDAGTAGGRLSDTFFATGDGLVFGLKLSMDGGGTIGPFYGEFDAAIGFDLSMMKYQAPEPPCTVSEFGINNWYIRGNAYAYIDAYMGIEYDLWFASGRAEIFNAFAAVAMKTEFPNPSFFSAQIYASYSVLGGAIKGSVNFKWEEGNQISPECFQADIPSGPAELSIPLIGDTYPTEEDRPPVFVKPQVAFNLPINEVIETPVYDDNFNFVRTDYYRPVLKDIFLTKGESTERITASKSQTSNDASLTINGLLEATTAYKFHIKYAWEKNVGGTGDWQTVFIDGETTETDHIVEFTTDNFPTEMIASTFKLSQPANGQHFWTEDYGIPMIEFAQQGWDQLFPASAEEAGEEGNYLYDYTVKLTGHEKDGTEKPGKVYSFPVTEYPGMVAYETEEIVYKNIYLEEAGVTLNIPSVEIISSTGEIVEFEGLKDIELENESLYKLEILRVPIIETANVNITEGVVDATILDADGNPTTSDNFSIGLSIPTAKIDTPEDYGAVKVLYEMWFGTSSFDSFSDKVNTCFSEKLQEATVSIEVNSSFHHPYEKELNTTDPLSLGLEEETYQTNTDILDYLAPGEGKLGRSWRARDMSDIVFSIDAEEGFDEFDIQRLNANLNSDLELHPYRNSNYKSDGLEPVEKEFFDEGLNKRIDEFCTYYKNIIDQIVDDFVDNEMGSFAGISISNAKSSFVNGLFGQSRIDYLDYLDFIGEPQTDYKGWITINDAGIKFVIKNELNNNLGLDIYNELLSDFSNMAIFGQKPEESEGWNMLLARGNLNRFSTSNGTAPDVDFSEGPLDKSLDLVLLRPGIIGKQSLAFSNIVEKYNTSIFEISSVLFSEYRSTIGFLSGIGSSSFSNKFMNLTKENKIIKDYIDFYDNNENSYPDGYITAQKYRLKLKFPDIENWNYVHERIDANSYNWHVFTVDNIINPSGFDDGDALNYTQTPSYDLDDDNPLSPIQAQTIISYPNGTNDYAEAIELFLDWHSLADYGIKNLWLATHVSEEIFAYIDLENEEEDIYNLSTGERVKVFYDSEIGAGIKMFHYHPDHLDTFFDAFYDIVPGYTYIEKTDGTVERVNNVHLLTPDNSQSDTKFTFESYSGTIPQREQLLRFPRNLEVNPLQMLVYSLGTANPFEVEAISVFDDEGKNLILWREDQKIIYTHSGDFVNSITTDFPLQTAKGTEESNVLFEMEPQAEYTIYIRTDKGDESFITNDDYWVNRGGESAYRWDETHPDAIFLPLDGNNALAFESDWEVDLTGNAGNAAAGLDLGLPIQDLTLEAWVNFSNTNASSALIFGFETNTSAPFGLFQNGADLQFKLNTSSGEQTVTVIGGASVNNWSHVAATFDGNEMRILLNGIEVASTAHAGFINYDADGYLKLGAGNFEGMLDEVSLWRSARSQSEIIADAEAGPFGLTSDNNQQIPNLIAYYTFDKNWKDTTFPNLGGTGQNGELLGNYNATTDNLWMASQVPQALNVAPGDLEEEVEDITAPENMALEFFEGGGAVEIPYAAAFDEISSNFTFEFWARSSEISPSSHSILRRIDGYGVDLINGNELRCVTWGADDVNFGPYFISDGTWHQYVMTGANGNERKLYRDGILVTENNSDYEISSTNNPLYIGYGFDNTRVAIDEVGIWKTARSAEEIYDDFLDTAVPIDLNGNLIAFYTFDELTTSTTVTDQSNNNNGSITQPFTTIAGIEEPNFAWVAGAELTASNYVPVSSFDALYAIEPSDNDQWRPIFKNSAALVDVKELALYNSSTGAVKKWYSSLHHFSGDIANSTAFEGTDWIGDLLPNTNAYTNIYILTNADSLYTAAAPFDAFTALQSTALTNTPYDNAGSAADQEKTVIKLDRQVASTGALTGNIQFTYRNSQPIEAYDIAIYDAEMNRQAIYFAGEDRYREYTFNQTGGQDINLRDWDGKYQFNMSMGEDYSIFLRKEVGGDYQYQLIDIDDDFWNALSVIWIDPNVDFEAAPQLAGYFEIGDYALEFDGNDEYVTSQNITIGNKLTVECWINANDATPSNRRYVFNQTDGIVILLRSSGKLEATFYNGLGYISTVTVESIPANEWMHVAYTYDYDNNVVEFFLNGVSKGTTNAAKGVNINIPAKTTNPQIGGHYKYLDRSWDGKLDEFGLWNYILSPAEVQNNYLYGIDPTASGLLLYYNFNDGPGSNILSNVIGGDKHGELTGMSVMTDWVAANRQATDYNPGAYTLTLDANKHPILKYREDNDWYNIAEIYVKNADNSQIRHWFNGYLYELDSDGNELNCADIPDFEAVDAGGNPLSNAGLLIDSSSSFEVFLKTTDGIIYKVSDTQSAGFQLLEEVEQSDSSVPDEIKDNSEASN